MLPVEQPFKTYTGLDGKPLDNGYVYFGQPNQDPIAHPVTVYWDAAGTLPASQPLRTVKGYIMRAGAAANVFFGSAYSELVLDSKNRQVFYAQDSNEFSVNTPVAQMLGEVRDSLATFAQTSTGKVFSNEGAHVNRVNDRLFVGKTATSYDGKGPALVSSWVGVPSSGIYEYLETNATFGAYAEGSGLGMFAAARTSATSGTPGEVSIGMAAFAYNDKPAGSSGAWCFYGTALREPGTNGSTLGIEIDVANLGLTASCFPASIFPAGVSAGLWIASGGEATNNQNVGTASAAMVILSNDGGAHLPRAKFDKGIVFHNQSIEGCDGATGYGVAIAFARGHAINWFANNNAGLGGINHAVDTPANATNISFSDAGLAITASDNKQIFQVKPIVNAANFLQVEASIAGEKVRLSAVGTDTNVDMMIAPKGTGVLQVSYGSTAATNPASFSPTRCLAFKDGNNITWYIPLSATPW